MKSKTFTIAAALAALTACSSVSGGTKLWYRFDERAAGYTTKDGDSFLNAVGSSAYPGTPYTAESGPSTWNTSTPARMPLYSGGFPDGYYILDPLTGLVHANTNSIFFSSVNTNAYGRSGIVAVADDSALYGSAFTLEFFVKCAKSQSAVWETVMSRIDSDGAYTWTFRQNGGNLTGYFVCNVDGTRTGVDIPNINLWKHGSLLNTKWHHLAVAVDQTAGTAKIYVDYELVHTATLTGPLANLASGHIVLGSGNENYGHFDGDYDEFRISDGALGPESFLHIQRMEDPRVVYRQSFTPIDSVFYPVTNAFVNEKAPSPANYILTNAPASFARLLSWSDATATNDTVCLMQSTADGANAALSIPLADYDVLTNGDFTVEMFVRLPSDGMNSESYLVNLNDGIRARFQGGATLSVMQGWSGKASITVGNDFWHHVAWVVSRTAGKVYVYFDYALAATLSYAMPNMAYGTTLYIGSFNGSANKFKTLWLDEVRITKAVLDADKFLRPAGADEGGSCRVTFSASDFATYGLGLNGRAVERPAAWGSYAMDSTNLPSATIYDGRFDRTGVTNTLSARFIGNASGFSGFYKIPDDTENPLADGSFTAEMFAYCGGFSGAGLDVCEMCFLAQTNAFWMQCLLSPPRLVASDSSRAQFASKGISAGRWYHIAYVQDVENDELRLYLDGKLVGKKSGIPARTGGDPGRYIYVMSNPKKDYYGCFSNAWADEVRLTRRALTPEEFLMAGRFRQFVIFLR